MSDPPRDTIAAMHRETARIGWSELERHFARGVVIRVAPQLDLVRVAAAFADDDASSVGTWTSQGDVRHLDAETARRWSAGDADLWAVVVAPWVLVQEPDARTEVSGSTRPSSTRTNPT